MLQVQASIYPKKYGSVAKDFQLQYLWMTASDSKPFQYLLLLKV